MKTLTYANTLEKAALIRRWAEALAAHVPVEATVQTIRGAGPAEREAGRILAEGLSPSGGIASLVVREGVGSPEEAIAAQAMQGDYQLVLVAPAGRKGFIRLFYGSMVANVVRRVSTSVLVARAGGKVPPRRILLGVSASRHSLTNVSMAAQLASFFGAELSILMVLSQVSLDLAGAEPWEGGTDRFLTSEHPLASHLRVARQLAERMGATPRLRVRDGLIAEELVAEIAESDADLLVIGTHRAEDFDTVYEDLTDELVQAAPISTLVVGLRAALL